MSEPTAHQMYQCYNGDHWKSMLIHRSLVLPAILACLLSACVPTPRPSAKLEPRTVEVGDAQSILIQVDYGEVRISGSDDSQVSIEGQVLFAEKLEYSITSTDEQILIKVFANRDSSSAVPLHVAVRLPQQVQLRVETNNASVFLQGLQGDFEIASASGDITVEQTTGRMTLQSNRGTITVKESSGITSIVGNYGALTALDVRGDTAISTIMGNITFSGLIAGDDAVRLETDHGSVAVNLKDDSALALQVSSTSGDVTCMLPGMTSSTRTCSGVMNSGGRLSVRTVSGAATLQLIP